MSDGGRWQRLGDLFQEAVKLPEEERDRFAAEACAGDRELYRELASLLAADARSWSLVDGPAPAVPDGEEPCAEKVPSRIGPYRVLEEIGRGGMGTVYAAMRDDPHYRKRVAIKLIRHGMGAEFLLGRFRRERQILADLEHPGIARLLDGGGTADGRPYLVMEHIEGEPIDLHCDRRRLPLRRRLELFAAICDAVHYAHQSLVVHRDLKPSNILVTGSGSPRLLDFGTAKLLEPSHGDRDAAPTTVGWRLMTPAFASPEQIRGERITTASDIYSLGVLLHWLLTGHSPYPGTPRGGRSLEWAICEAIPQAPSAAFGKFAEGRAAADPWTPKRAARLRGGTPRQLRRQLRGDLDAIVARALAKLPQHRYQSVRELAGDVCRHLASQPVRARQGALGYRVGRLLRRNPVAALATTVAAALLALGVLATSWQARVAVSERSRAEQAAAEAQSAQERAQLQQATAEEVSGFFVDLFREAGPGRDGRPSPTAHDLLDRGAGRIEALSDRPLVQAAVRQSLGVAYEMIGDYEAASEHLGAALTTRQALLGGEDLDVAESLELLGRVVHDGGDPRAAEPLFRQAVRLRVARLGEEHPSLLRPRHNLAVVLLTLGDHDGAAAILERVLDRVVLLLGQQSAEAGAVATSLAATLVARGDIAAAEPLVERALAASRESLGDSHPQTAAAMLALADLRREQGRLIEAGRLTREGIAVWRERLPPLHPRFADGAAALAAIARRAGDHEEAERRMREAVELCRLTLPPGHPQLGDSLVTLGEYLVERGRPRAAEPLLREALETIRSALPASHWKVAQAEGALGVCLAARGRTGEAGPLLVRSHQRLRERLGEQHPEAVEAALRLDRFYEGGDDVEAAVRLAAWR